MSCTIALIEALPPQSISNEFSTLLRLELKEFENEMYRATTEQARCSILCAVVKSWALLTDFEQATAVLDKADAGEMAFFALEALADVAIQRMEPAHLPAVLSTIKDYIETFEDEESYVLGLASLIEMMLCSKMQHDALTLLEETIQALPEMFDAMKQDNKAILRIIRCLSQIEGLESKKALFEQLLSLVGKIESQDEQIEVLVAMGKILPKLTDFHATHVALESENISSLARRRFISAWQSALLEMPTPPLPVMRYTLCCFPFEPSMGSKGSQCLAAALLKNEQETAYDAVVQQCSVLLSESGFTEF